jgi:hypothetical protein
MVSGLAFKAIDRTENPRDPPKSPFKSYRVYTSRDGSENPRNPPVLSP